VSALGKVVALEAPENRPGFIVVTIHANEAEAAAWSHLWGRDVQAGAFIPPAEAATPTGGQASLNLEPKTP
jgi:hypothetical protein